MVFARDRADLGPAHAARLAATEAAAYAPVWPYDAALADLRAAWADEQRLRDRLEAQQLHRAALESRAARHAEAANPLSQARAAEQQTSAAVTAARQQAAATDALITADTDRIHGSLLGRWHAER